MARILIINHYAGSHIHGMEYRPYYLAREWVKMGHQPAIIACSASHVRSKAPNIKSLITEETIDGIPYIWIKSLQYSGNGVRRAMNIFSFVVSTMISAPYLASSLTPDVVIASSTYPLDILAARRIAALQSAKLVFEVHDLWPLSPIELGNMSPFHPFILLMQWAENYAYRHADKVISMLPNAIDHMIQHGMATSKFAYVPNGIDAAEWEREAAPLPDEHAAALDTMRRQGNFIVGYAGAHGAANALDTLVAAAKHLEDNSVSFVLIGQGPEKNHLQDLARQMSARNVIFLPPVSRQAVPTLLSAMDSLYIGLQSKPLFRFGISPNKLMDYMMAARPVINAISAGNDPVADADCGISVAPEDPDALARAVKRLMSMSEEQRIGMGMRGRRYVTQNHDYSVLAQRFLESIR